MSQPQGFSAITFCKKSLLPMALVFVIPVCGWFFFRHAQRWFNDDARAAILRQIQADADMTAEDRAAAVQFFTEHPFSELLDNPQFAAQVPQRARIEFGVVRWMIRLAGIAVLLSVAVIVFAGICVFLAHRSQRAQYLSLLLGWHVMRIYGAAQAVIQGALLVGLSYWVTALWFERISVKLILIVAVLAVCGVAAVLVAIFKRPKMEFAVAGTVLPNDPQSPWREALRSICAKVGTPEPDQIVVGIDDGFFVTENPVTVAGRTLEGRTLFMSLALLKQLDGREAEAILAHEMAHFSGQDTLYSKKIAPLLARFGNYLQSLYEGGITQPIFYFMNGFLSLFQLSLGKISRQREFRADQIAAEKTSPHDMASALLRTVAYSKFRQQVEEELFQNERALESANISERIETGFPAFAVSFIGKQQIGEMETVHPFDSHPPTAERTTAVGVPLHDPQVAERLARIGDGAWYAKIPQAAELERAQWQKIEENFRSIHEQSLPYRFLPANEAEQAIVAAAFPPCEFASSKGTLKLNYEQLDFTGWMGPIKFAEVTKFDMNEGTLTVRYNRLGSGKETINMNKFPNSGGAAIDAMNRYYGRYLSAMEYQQFKQAQAAKVGS